MALRDHFHPPLVDKYPWESFHAAWAIEIMAALNGKILPPDCFAAAQVHVGSHVEIDVATFDEAQERAAEEGARNGGVAVATWAPPATSLVMPAVFPDEIEVQVFQRSGGSILVGTIELVSPGNKDRPEARRAFAAKCASYLQQGVGLVIVDVVTQRQANLHDELIGLLEQPGNFAFPEETAIYATSYRPSRRPTGDQIEMWLTPLALGQPLAIVPLALRGVATVPVDLETTYNTTCVNCRLKTS